MLYIDYLDNFVQRNTLNPDQIDGSNISDKIAAGTITMSETAFSYIQNWVTPSGLVGVEFITDKLDAEAGYIKGEFTFTASGAIAMSTDANNGLWISPTGILGKKAGVNTFAITNQGDATFGGNVTGATISGGTISIGSSNSIFKADSNGIYLGNTTFANAPFRVAMDGSATASNLNITGGSISWANVSAPSYTQVTGTKPPTDADNTYSTIGANRLTYITSTGIYSGTITGNTVQTSEDANTGVKMGDAYSGISIYGQTLKMYEHLGTTLYGYLGTYGGYYNIQTVGNRNLLVTTGSGTMFYSGASVSPLDSGSGTLGLSSQYWNDVYTNNLTLASGKYFNYTGGYIQSNSQFRVVGSISLTGNLVFENNASITINGRAFYATTGAYDASKYYLRS